MYITKKKDVITWEWFIFFYDKKTSIYIYICLYVFMLKNVWYILQLVTTVPTSTIPKNVCRRLRGRHEEDEEVDHDIMMEEEDVGGRRGQILWVRGLTRLQQQVGGHFICLRSSICHINKWKINLVLCCTVTYVR